MGIWQSILTGLGVFLRFIYKYLAFENYGMAIIVFTLITKALLFPLTMKQLRSSSKMQELQPEIQKIQKQYSNDKNKMNEEMMKLYKKHNYNPASGCLPLIVQMPILIALYRVLIKPITYMFKIPQFLSDGVTGKTVINKAEQTVTKLAQFAKIESNDYTREIGIVDWFSKNPDEMKNVSELIRPDQIVNLNFLGLNLGKKPTINFDLLFGPNTMSTYLPLLIIPILATLLTFLSSRMMSGNQKQSTTLPTKDDKSQNMQKSMMYLGPAMTLYFSFILPAGMGLYWISTYAIQIIQQLYVNNSKKKEEEAKENRAVKKEDKET